MACDRTLLKNIDHLCGEGNAPDLKPWIAITSADDIATYPAMSTTEHKYTGNFTMRAAVVGPPAVPAGVFQKWEFDEMSENGLEAAYQEGGFYQPKIELFIEKLDAAKTFTLMASRGADKVVVATDNNGKMRVMKNARVVFDETTKTKNGYKVTITCGKTPDPLPYYEGTLAF